jgi:stress response protein SCP2
MLMSMIGMFIFVYFSECTWSDNDRVATLDTEESMCINEYCTELPAELSLGFNWETVPKSKMSVDLGCVMLNSKWEYVDAVHAEQLQTSCSSVKHGGEEQRDAGGDKDDQMIHVTLATVPENVTYICFYITSTNAEDKLDHGVLCAAKLMDKATERVMSVFTVSDKKQFDYYCAMHMCFLFKMEDKWYFQVAGAGAACVTTELIAEHAKKYLMDKRATQRRMQINSNNAKLKKRYELSSKHATPR